MAYTHTLVQNWTNGGRTIQVAKPYTGDGETSREIAVPDDADDMLVNIAIDVDQVQMLYMHSDEDVTIETNNGTTPDDTINLLAGVPLVWHASSYFDNPLTVDVTTFYVTSGGVAATLVIEVLEDSTP